MKSFFLIFGRRPPGGVLVLSPDTKVESFSGKEFGVRSKGVICRMAIKKKLPEPLDIGLIVSERSYLVVLEGYPNAPEYVDLDHDQLFLHLFPVPRTHISADWNRNGSKGAWKKLNFSRFCLEISGNVDIVWHNRSVCSAVMASTMQFGS